MMDFIWNNKHPRVTYAIIPRHKNEEGLGIPNLRNYYTACLLDQVVHCWNDSADKQWISTEKSSLKVNSLCSPVIGSAWKLGPYISPLLTVQISINAWKTFLEGLSDEGHTSPPRSKSCLMDHIPGLDLKIWIHRGIKSVREMTCPENMLSFTHIHDTYQIPHKDFYMLLKSRSFLGKRKKSSVQMPAIAKMVAFPFSIIS